MILWFVSAIELAAEKDFSTFKCYDGQINTAKLPISSKYFQFAILKTIIMVQL